jgi:protein KRI1
LNRGWVDGGDHNYADMSLDAPRASAKITVDADDSEGDEAEPKAGPSHPWGLLDEDEFDEKADEFETGYNFRFEEP